MRDWLFRAPAAAAFAAALILSIGSAGAAKAADTCAAGNDDARIACLSGKIDALEAKLDQMSKAIDSKADARSDDMPGTKPKDDIVRFDSVISIHNQDMRIFPRCLDNPGPDSPDMSAVMATSCAPAAGQAWIIMRAMD